MIKIGFHELAEREMLEARDFYDNLVFGLGKKFISDLEYIINLLRENPLIFPVKFDSYRTVPLRKFPYSIIFRLDKDDEVIILAVAHQKRKPNYWATRK